MDPYSFFYILAQKYVLKSFAWLVWEKLFLIGRKSVPNIYLLLETEPIILNGQIICPKNLHFAYG